MSSPAQLVTPELINFMTLHGRGLICLALTRERCDPLGLPQMAEHNTEELGTAFTVSIDAERKYPGQSERPHDWRPESIRRQLDASLQRLQTDRIELYQLHNVSNLEALDQVLAPGGAYEAVVKARDAGKVRCIGISSHSIATATAALETGLFQTLQFPFNFIESDPVEALFPLALRQKVGTLWRPTITGRPMASASSALFGKGS